MPVRVTRTGLVWENKKKPLDCEAAIASLIASQDALKKEVDLWKGRTVACEAEIKTWKAKVAEQAGQKKEVRDWIPPRQWAAMKKAEKRDKAGEAGPSTSSAAAKGKKRARDEGEE